MKINKTNKAFTLVELIVVITILAILGTIAFISLQGYSKSSRDSVRISDISNMKTALELFHLNAGKYPLPDDNQEVTFSGNTLWYQGEFGNNVVSQLSRNISEVSTDPLTDKKYIFSVANNKNEFEILALLESDLVLNSIEQTNAATITVTPRIDGTFNGVFIKTQHHIVPVPSIINSEVEEIELVLDGNNIKSQVISNGGNIPNHGNVNYSTGELNGLVLSVYTGSLDKNSDDNDKEEAIIAIQGAYTGSALANDIKYANILRKTEAEDLVILFNTVVLGNSTIKTTPSILTQKTVSDCGTGTGEIIYGTLDGTDIGLTCDNDIIVCNGITGSGITLSACNVGTNIVGTGTGSYGGLYQWGNNFNFRGEQFINLELYPTTSSTKILVTATGSSYSYSTFISRNRDWNETQNDNLWGNIPGTDIDRKGPCNNGYHIPTHLEWENFHTAGLWLNNGLDMSNAMKMPLTSIRDTAGFLGAGGSGHYWSSSPKDIDSYIIYFTSASFGWDQFNYRAYGFPVRCFKN